MTGNEEKNKNKTTELTFAFFLSEVGAAALGGTIHSFIETPIVIPIEASITQIQINGQNFVKNFISLMKGGHLYRALPTALLGAAPKAIIHYSWLILYSNLLIESGSVKTASVKEAIIVGLATGASEVGFSTPLNFCKFRMQRPEWGYTGLRDAITTIAREEGVSAFWKGTLPTFCRNSVCMGGMLGGYKWLKPQIPESYARANLCAGMFGGLVGSFLSYPFEMWRAAQMHNRNFREEMLARGTKRLFAGYIPGATRLIITSGIMGELLPRLKGWANTMKGGIDTAQNKNKKEKKDKK